MIRQMTFLRSPDKVAGLLFLFAALLVLTIWFQLLFHAPASDLSPAGSASLAIEQMFSPENPSRLWFVWLAFLPLACAALGTSYLLNLARTKTGGMILFVISVGLGTTVFVFTQWPLALFVALPCYWGFLCAYRS